MGQNSAIEWTEATWNPLTGCDKISPGCTNCYAERMSLRLPDGAEKLPQRLRPDAASARPGAAPQVEETATYLRQLDERSVSQGRARRIHPTGFRDDAASVVASVSDTHEAF